MKTIAFYKPIFGAVALAFVATIHPASASVISPVQTSADPLKLPVAAPVQMAGSDAAATQFMQALPAISSYIKQTLPEYTALNSSTLAAMALDPNTLRLAANSSVRAYFISEGAAYHNALGFNTFAAGAAVPTASTPGVTADAKLIFPDASSSDPTTLNPGGLSIRTANEPLLKGDFVDMGTFSAGTLLDFFLLPNAANTPLTDEAARNSDKLQHMVTFSAAGSNYLVISYEDAVGGGDKDYNDMIFALQFTTMAPEPKTWAGLALFGFVVVFQSLRRPASQVGLA